ncbi:hypothetical protein CEB3_c22270 [Peptococcaceae bacterium CEB3]|nr:hypothetical protein CEB3_c22270 [Peptococcaceae bacterium CEB3]
MKITLRELTREDLPAVQALLERCSAYLTFQDEEPVKPGAALELFSEKPDGVEESDKVLFGIVNEAQELVGLFDVLRGYPDPKTLNLGLMLLEPASRGKGIGEKACKALATYDRMPLEGAIRINHLAGMVFDKWLFQGRSGRRPLPVFQSHILDDAAHPINRHGALAAYAWRLSGFAAEFALRGRRNRGLQFLESSG